MRQHPIGTGPFKFVSYKPNESIKLVRNPNYWKQGRPYLDGIEWTIVPNRSTAVLAFVAGKFDMTFPFGITVPLMHDINKQAPQAHCDLEPANQSTNLVVNRDAPPFDNPDIRRAMALALDRKSFIDILAEGHGDIGGAMQPPPQGVWGMPAEMLRTLPGYDPDIAKNRAEARELMQKAGYGPDKRLADQGVGAQHAAVSRSRRHSDRSASGHLYRRGTRNRRDRQLVPEGIPQGLQGWAQPDRRRDRRPRCAIL